MRFIRTEILLLISYFFLFPVRYFKDTCPHFSNERQFEMTPDIFHVIKVQGI
jgi:hypothetical protein